MGKTPKELTTQRQSPFLMSQNKEKRVRLWPLASSKQQGKSMRISHVIASGNLIANEDPDSLTENFPVDNKLQIKNETNEVPNNEIMVNNNCQTHAMNSSNSSNEHTINNESFILDEEYQYQPDDFLIENNEVAHCSGTRAPSQVSNNAIHDEQKRMAQEIRSLRVELFKMHKKIGTLQEMVRDIPAKISMLLAQQQNRNFNEESERRKTNLHIDLPLISINEFYECSVKCANEEYSEMLIKRLSLSGGTNLRKTVRNVINNLFSVELQSMINYTGKNEKIQLSSTPFADIILDAVREIREVDFCVDTARDELKFYLQRGLERFRNSAQRPNIVLVDCEDDSSST